jgi:hypothetical protein
VSGSGGVAVGGATIGTPGGPGPWAIIGLVEASRHSEVLII